MNIAVFTFFCNGNYGSELQAIAMNHACRKLGHNPIYFKIQASNKLERLFEKGRDLINVTFHRLTNKEYRSYYKARKINAAKQRMISTSLKNKIISLSQAILNTATVSAHSYSTISGVHCYICGSDQIWSALKIPISKEYFFAGIPTNLKVAYAPSFGLNELPTYFCKSVMKYIKDFKYLSVRESQARDEIKKHTGKEAQLVLDPTLMVGKAFWEGLLEQRRLYRPIQEPYVLCYFLGEMSKMVVDNIKGLYPNQTIVCLPYESEASIFSNGQYIEADQFEFINLIKHADMVFTDSFHGSVFSLLFNVHFAVVGRTHERSVTQTSRIESVLSLFGLNKHFCHNEKELRQAISFEINYAAVNETMEQLKNKSRCFLEGSLREIEKYLKNE
jgi:hypothetical protein